MQNKLKGLIGMAFIAWYWPIKENVKFLVSRQIVHESTYSWESLDGVEGLHISWFE